MRIIDEDEAFEFFEEYLNGMDGWETISDEEDYIEEFKSFVRDFLNPEIGVRYGNYIEVEELE